MGPLASLDQRKEVRERIRELAAGGRDRRRRPRRGDRRLRRRREGRLPEPGRPLLPTTRSRATAIHDVEAFGPVSTVMPYDDLDEAIALARRGKGSPRRLGLHRRQGGRRGSRPRPRPVPRPRADRQPPERQDLHRPRLAAAGPRPRRPRPRRRRRGDGRHPRRQALHAAHRRPGRPAPALRRHRPLDRGRRRPERRRPPVPQVAGRAQDRRPARHRHPRGHARRHRAFRRLHRRHLLRPHGRGGREGEPVLRRPRRPRLPDRLLRRRPLRRPGPGPGPRQLRRRQPALPHARSTPATPSACGSPARRSTRAPTPTTARSAGTAR